MYDYKSRHIGKDLFRSKKHEEDIIVIPEMQQELEISISLKAYGDGPLQLSTDKESSLFCCLDSQNSSDITDKNLITDMFKNDAFKKVARINILPLIYREDKKECCMATFKLEKAIQNTARIVKVDENNKLDKTTGTVVPAKGRLHPVFLFLNENNEYICEVRYGGKSANALQRGLWTHTKNAAPYFTYLTDWISYEHNMVLVKLFSLALNSTKEAHIAANDILQEGINRIKCDEQ